MADFANYSLKPYIMLPNAATTPMKNHLMAVHKNHDKAKEVVGLLMLMSTTENGKKIS
jgi:hypothetical protein